MSEGPYVTSRLLIFASDFFKAGERLESGPWLMAGRGLCFSKSLEERYREGALSGFISAHQSIIGRVTLFDIGPPIAEHAHPHVHLLFKLAGADRTMAVSNRTAVMSDDELVFVSPWEPHCDRCRPSDDRARVIALYIHEEWVAKRYLMRPNPGNPALPISDAMRTLLKEVAWSLAATTLSNAQRVEARIADLLDLVMEARLALRPRSDLQATDFRIRRAVGIMREDPHLWRNFEELARKVGLSRSRFFEQFRHSIGVPPSVFADGLLIERAIQHLTSSDRTIVDISDDLGFSAQSNFCRFFKDRVGFPPSDFRRAMACSLH